jgi:hypothetical protein
MVVAPAELAQIGIKVIFAEMVTGTNDPTFEQREGAVRTDLTSIVTR